MGVLYSVLPLNNNWRAALTDYGVVDRGWPDGRNPRLAEILEVVNSIPDFVATPDVPPAAGGSWGITVEHAGDPENGAWTQLRTLSYSEVEPIEFYFEKGWPELIVEILARLANHCGTLCVVPDTGEAPLPVPAGADSQDLLNAWEHTQPSEDAGTQL